jgi:hypothetical protein
MRKAQKLKLTLLAEYIQYVQITNAQHFSIIVQLMKDEMRKQPGYVSPTRKTKKKRCNNVIQPEESKSEVPTQVSTRSKKAKKSQKQAGKEVSNVPK